MPLEIRELIIRTQIVTVDEKRDKRSEVEQQYVDTKLIVDQCIAKVLKALRNKMER